MRSLLELEAFESLSDNLRSTADSLPSQAPVTLLAPATLQGAFALAQLEAALLDADIGYRRRFLPREASGSCVEVGEGNARASPIPPTKSPSRIRLVPLTVIGLRGHEGAKHSGTLSPVAQAAAIAELIAPDGVRVRRMRPWALAGNWCSEGLDQGYDPVYSRLRDHLRDEGCIRVVPLPEVQHPNLSSLPAVDVERLESTGAVWESMDMEQRANALSTVALPQVVSSKPPTARLEELLWHRVLIGTSGKDLHSMVAEVIGEWDESPTSVGGVVERLLKGLY